MKERRLSGIPVVAPALQNWVSARMAEKSAILNKVEGGGGGVKKRVKKGDKS